MRLPRRRTLLLLPWLLAGCNDTRDLAPASADMPAFADAGGGGHAPRFGVPRDPALPPADDPADIDPRHAYGLDELIDIAERRSKTTRIAWEQARQAAIDVGVARAAYLPSLTADALVGYQRLASPFPNTLVPKGYITAQAQEALPELAVRYLLLDFGGRRAAVGAARQLSFASNVAFTAAHQRLILAVASAYFTLDGVNAQLRAAEQTLASDRLLLQSAGARFGHGLGTVVDVDLARRGTAQAGFDIAAATAAQHDAMYDLLAAMDLPPTTVLRVRDSSAQTLDRNTGATVDEVMHKALQRRPDLVADLARLRAASEGIEEARSEFDPKLSISANVQGNLGRISTDGLPYESVEQPQAGLFLRFDWPLYAGGVLRNRLRLAQSRRAEAADALEEATEQDLREVAVAYDRVKTGLSQYDAAVALRTAAQTAADSAGQAYANGVGTFTDAVGAQSTLAAARASVARAHSQSLIDAASLAFATGALTSSEAPGLAAEGTQ